MHVTTVLVTHDQNEALEVADHLLLLNEGQVVQSGTPGELYDHPATEFVLRFLGPSTTLDSVLVRPHDLDVVASGDGTPATITDVTMLGFEIRVALRLDDGQELWAQMARADFEQLGVAVGSPVGLRRRADAVSLPAPSTTTGDVPRDGADASTAAPGGVDVPAAAPARTSPSAS